MSLVDVAHGKHRHVPYRDSRLTFLLQVRQLYRWLLFIKQWKFLNFFDFNLIAGFSWRKLKNNNYRKCQSFCLVWIIIIPLLHLTIAKTFLCIVYSVIKVYLLCSSASETLSTLKFAQRAKLIQNNVAALHYMSILVKW